MPRRRVSFMSNRDSIKNTFLVTGALCIICSVLVSGAAVGLKEKQDANAALDLKKNILSVSGIDFTDGDVEQLFTENIQARIVELTTGEYVNQTTSGLNLDTFDVKKLASDEMTDLNGDDPAGIGGERENYAVVYLFPEKQQLILPVRGKGLWSTLKGFVSVSADDFTTRGITFYSHGETPGLGGEVDNPAWKAQWSTAKETLDANGQVILNVTKSGAAGPNDIDGLAGATITTQGVDKLIKYWLGNDGFGAYLKSENKFTETSN